VTLTHDEEENEKRMVSEERCNLVEGGKGMLLDPEVLAGMKEVGELAKTEHCSASIYISV
jgi:hypothetical protein